MQCKICGDNTRCGALLTERRHQTQIEQVRGMRHTTRHQTQIENPHTESPQKETSYEKLSPTIFPPAIAPCMNPCACGATFWCDGEQPLADHVTLRRPAVGLPWFSRTFRVGGDARGLVQDREGATRGPLGNGATANKDGLEFPVDEIQRSHQLRHVKAHLGLSRHLAFAPTTISTVTTRIVFWSRWSQMKCTTLNPAPAPFFLVQYTR